MLIFLALIMRTPQWVGTGCPLLSVVRHEGYGCIATTEVQPLDDTNRGVGLVTKTSREAYNLSTTKTKPRSIEVQLGLYKLCDSVARSPSVFSVSGGCRLTRVRGRLIFFNRLYTWD